MSLKNGFSIGAALAEAVIAARKSVLFAIAAYFIALLPMLAFGGIVELAYLKIVIDNPGKAFALLEIIRSVPPVAMGASIILLVLATGLIFTRMSLLANDRPADLMGTLISFIRKLPRLIILFAVLSVLLLVANFLIGLLLGIIAQQVSPIARIGLALLATVPGIWVVVRWMPAPAVALCEDRAGLFGALSRGYEMTIGIWPRIAIVVIVAQVGNHYGQVLLMKMAPYLYVYGSLVLSLWHLLYVVCTLSFAIGVFKEARRASGYVDERIVPDIFD